jgi:hydroxyacylglutathione hydrolase
MQKKIILLTLILILSGCLKKTGDNDYKRIYTIDTGISNVFLIKGNKGNILIDTGNPDKEQLLINELKADGIAPENISLIILTHGHCDHVGNARFFKDKYNIPVLIGREDELMAESGKNRELKPTALLGALLKPFVDVPFKPFKADILVSDNYNLEKYGIDGEVIHVGGHTDGSLAVILHDGNAFVGDLIRGGLIAPQDPALHFFHENPEEVNIILKSLLKKRVKLFYTGHFGPLKADKVREYLKKN